mmetsp:Transcript_17832/g.41585  ORF Transcript_17832/g.41585 Transcript_17832/m.41585 type:complete len:87 (-) Transcript_17832:44-304(-)
MVQDAIDERTQGWLGALFEELGEGCCGVLTVVRSVTGPKSSCSVDDCTAQPVRAAQHELQSGLRIQWCSDVISRSEGWGSHGLLQR